MITVMVLVMETFVVVVMLVAHHLAAWMELPTLMVYWLPVAVERPVEESRVLFLVLPVEPMALERSLVEKELEKLVHRKPRRRVNHSVDKSVHVPPGACYNVYRS